MTASVSSQQDTKLHELNLPVLPNYPFAGDCLGKKNEKAKLKMLGPIDSKLKVI